MSTSEFLLRPWSEADAVGLRAAIDEDVEHLKPWLSWTLEEPATLERTRARLREWVERFAAGQAYRYAIVPAAEPARILGGASLSSRFGPNAYDVGYWVRRSAARQGLATAAVSRLAVHAFAQTHVNRLLVQCDIANTRSAAMARVLGFEPIGSATTTYPDGAPRPVLRFEMTREVFERSHAPAFLAHAKRIHIADSPALTLE